MIRDINAGRFSKNTSLVLVTHGLAARIFLMRWFHWSVAELLMVFNPPNAEVSCHLMLLMLSSRLVQLDARISGCTST